MGSAARFSRSKRKTFLERPDGGLGQAGADGARLEDARASPEDADRLVDRLAVRPLAMQVRTGIS